MQLARCAEDRVHRTDHQTSRATDAGVLIDDNMRRLVPGNVPWSLLPEQRGECGGNGLAAGQTAFDRRPAIGERRCVGFAAGVAALPALRSWQHFQHSSDGLGGTFALRAETEKQQSRDRKHQTEQQDQTGQHSADNPIARIDKAISKAGRSRNGTGISAAASRSRNWAMTISKTL